MSAEYCIGAFCNLFRKPPDIPFVAPERWLRSKGNIIDTGRGMLFILGQESEKQSFSQEGPDRHNTQNFTWVTFGQ